MIKISEEQKAVIEEQLLELPLVQYGWLDREELVFSERVRTICRQECPRYGTSWACPPGVGTVEECKKRCEGYDGVFLFTTIAEVRDVENMEETLSTRAAHEEVTRRIQEILENHLGEGGKAGPRRSGPGGLETRRTLALSAESCAICESCAYPEVPCRHPLRMIPCIESFGLLVPALAEKAGIEFMNGANIVTWFGLVLFGGEFTE